MKNKFKGTGVAIVTPFSDEGNIDYKNIERLVEHLITGGIDYLVVQGTTGESATLTNEEKHTMTRFVVEVNKKRLPVVLGIGGNNTRNIIEQIKIIDSVGVDAILSVNPYYNKPTQEGIYQHYKAISKESELPVILYNVPGRTASNITSDTTLRIADDCQNIIGIKEASGDLQQIARIIRQKPDDFLVISGDDALTLPVIALGGDGVISVVGNAFPAEISALVHHALSGDYARSRSVHYRLLPITEMIFAEGNPSGIKAVLKQLGICGDTMRLPLVNISNALYQKITTQLLNIN